MTIYRRIVAHEWDRRLLIHLSMLGAATKPFFLCTLEDMRKGPIPAPTLTFFMTQQPDPTLAIEATVSLQRGLTARWMKTSSLEQVRQLAEDVHRECQWNEDFQRIGQTCSKAEQDSI